MKSQLFVCIILPVITVMVGFNMVQNPDRGFGMKTTLVADTTEFDQEAALERLRAAIAGKEKMPASKVFENIKVFKQVPAGRMLRIMELGYAKSLGVTCTHCHNPENWASEEKPQKQIARDMSEMARKINNELLSTIENLESEKPVVNCTTCHRGEVKPALNLEK